MVKVALHCSSCGKIVSDIIEAKKGFSIIRAYIVCPECIEAKEKK